ncbi:MAG: hypothetical protein ACE367_01185 [Acidimicrobiales bacterium]
MEPQEDPGPELIVPGVARALSPLVRRILALNPGPRTGIGTNTYLIGIDEIVVVDPGPEDASHLDSVAGCGGDRIKWITWTQTGDDYVGGLEAMAERTGAEIFDPADGEVLLGTEFRIQAHNIAATGPGHRAYMLEEERMLLCGGLIADDRLAPLVPGQADMAALRAALEKASKMRLRRMAPVHGYIVEAPKKAIPAELEARDAMDESILAALAGGAGTPDELVTAIHGDVEDAEMVPVLRDSIEAHLHGLLAADRVKESGGTWAPA